MAIQQGQQGTPPPPAQDPVPRIIGDQGWGYPRWPLLAALCLMPCAIIGYLLETFFETHLCTFSTLCTIDQLPGWLQMVLIWAVFGLLWLFWLPYGVAHLKGSADPPGIAGFLRRISNFESVRWLLIAAGIVALVGILLDTLLQRITASIFALAMVVVFVALCTLFWHPLLPASGNSATDQYRREMQRSGSYFFVLRTLVPFRYLFLPRFRQNQLPGAQGSTQPANTANPPPQGPAATGNGAAIPPQPDQANSPPTLGN